MAISAPRAAPRPFGASVVITTSDYPHSWPTPGQRQRLANACNGSRFLHRQHIEKAEQRSRGGGGKIFYRGIRGNGYRYRGAKSGSRSDLSARHDSSKAIMSSQSSATKSHLRRCRNWPLRSLLVDAPNRYCEFRTRRISAATKDDRDAFS
jgi:hypothetical protein